MFFEAILSNRESTSVNLGEKSSDGFQRDESWTPRTREMLHPICNACDISGSELVQAFNDYQRLAPKPTAGPADAFPLNRLPPELQHARHWALQKLIPDVGLLPNSLAVAESWRQEFTALHRQRLSTNHPLRSLPFIVLERSEGTDDAWHAQQVQLSGYPRGAD
jgi:hypothetical protein